MKKNKAGLGVESGAGVFLGGRGREGVIIFRWARQGI